MRQHATELYLAKCNIQSQNLFWQLKTKVLSLKILTCDLSGLKRMVVDVTNFPEHLSVASEIKHFIETIRPSCIHIVH